MSRREVSVITALVKTLPRTKKYLVAVSGGIDSVVLLDALIRVRRLLKADIAVAHVDHSLRKDSASDAKFVEDICLQHEIVFHSIKLELPTRLVNVEQWGRTKRYTFFKELRNQYLYDFILTAHHSSDVAENFLMRLISNKELRGISYFDKKRALIRPLLEISKNQIIRHQTRFKLAFVTDSSNADVSYLRNRVRNKLIPMLENDFQRKTQVFLAERAMQLAQDLDALDEIAQKQYMQVRELDLNDSRELICALSVPISWRVIDYYFLAKLGYRLGRSKSLLIRKLLLGKIKKLDLPNGIKLIWQNKQIVCLVS